MITVVGIKFRENGKTEYYNPNGLDLKVGDEVLCDSAIGLRYGKVSQGNREIEEDKIENELLSVIRILTLKDKEKVIYIKERSKYAYIQSQKIIKKYGLDMKLLDAEYSFDFQKLMLTFSSEDRVDFRELLKELAQVFKVRIELRQIGIRDEVKVIGGLGPCGRVACCNLFLSDYGKVGIKMAKQQCLSLNPSNINGICGKIMCCIAYENDTYVENASLLPKINQIVKTPDGKGTVMYINILEKKVTVKLFGEESRLIEYRAEEIKAEDKEKQEKKEDVNSSIVDSQEDKENK